MGKRKSARAQGSWSRSRRSLAAVIIVLVVFLLLLDYVGWIDGLRSHVFQLLLGKHAAPDLTELYQMITRELAGQGVKRRSVSGFMDKDKLFHLKVELPLAKYKVLAAPLERKIADSGAKILNREATQEEGTVFYLWPIVGRQKQRLALLFACSLPPAKKPATAEKPPALKPPPPPGQAKLIALIMDDMGNSLDAAWEVCGLGLPITVSVLPYSLHDTETAQLAHECGLEVILHLPMESLSNHRTEKTTPGLILADMKDGEIRKSAEDALERVPYIRGVNNHMGSKLTEDTHAMSLIFEAMKGKGLYFIDSRTTPRSIACDLARTLGIPAGSSSVFLDPDTNGVAGLSRAEIKANFLGLMRLAQRTGQAVGIAHPRPATFSALKECLALQKNYDVSFVFASRLTRD
jgi:polysaccharide deacetylase 2 family uncharacterized protein YibQ